MAKRKILYGYQIEHGALVIHAEEASIVQRVFADYMEGASYQKLADSLNVAQIPFSLEIPSWDKHKVKRMLENPRYTGADGYPQIIDMDTFQCVKQRIAEKSMGQTSHKVPMDVLWPRLQSDCCHDRLLRTCGACGKDKGIYLRCASCGKTVKLKLDELLAQTARQLAVHDTPKHKPYVPSAEVINLANRINRTLEHPENGEDAVALILRGASARYDCCEVCHLEQSVPNPIEINWSRFVQVVSYIEITQTGEVTVHF